MAKDKKNKKKSSRMSRQAFDRELAKLQVELCELQFWVKEKGLRVVVLFEGRDAAGKGGVIKRMTERLNCISHMLSMISYEEVQFELPDLSERRERHEGVPDSVPFLHTVEQKY
jgi:polyphosphate kinase 2 (PPK2 family)